MLINKFKKKWLCWIIPITLLIAVLVSLILFKLVPIGTAYAPTDDFGEPVSVMNGLSITPQADGKLSEEELSGFIDEYGTNSNIIIYEVDD